MYPRLEFPRSRTGPDLIIRKRRLNKLNWLAVIFNDRYTVVLDGFERSQQHPHTSDGKFEFIHFERDVDVNV